MHIETSLQCGHQMKHLAKVKRMFFTGKSEGAANEDDDAASGGGRLGVDGADEVVAFIKGQMIKLETDMINTMKPLTFKSQHGGLMVERRKR